MDLVLMELARPRFQAAKDAAFVLDVGEGDLVVAREDVTLVKSGPTFQAATAVLPWTGTLGVVVSLGGADKGAAGKVRRVLVDLAQVVALRITD